MNIMETLGPGLGLIALGFALLFVALWTFLPFAIFGTKPLLKDILATQQETLTALNKLTEQLKTQKETAIEDATEEPKE